MEAKIRILVAPLDWGIGHATRCIPIINALVENNFEVVIAADERSLHLLVNEFPNLEIIRFSGYNINYPRYLPMSLSMLLQTPKILIGIKKENQELEKIIDDYNIHGVISDNRFGLWNNKVPSVFITHQLQIQSHYFQHKIQKLNYKYINKYSACWVIDNENNSLAGKLSTPTELPNNTIYIGPQSRFKKFEIEKKYDYLVIISGPEPQRTIFENGLTKALKKRKERSLIVLGKPELNLEKKIGHLTIKSHLNAKALNKAILQANLIICRPGYSTVMDLAKLEKKAFFIPTPEQTEQEYLADKFMKNKICYMQKQSEFNFDDAIKKSKTYQGFQSFHFVNKKEKDYFDIFK